MRSPAWSRRRRILGLRAAAAVTAVVVLAGCGSTIAGSATAGSSAIATPGDTGGSSTSTPASTGGSAGTDGSGGITVPSNGPGGGHASATSSTAATGATPESSTAPTTGSAGTSTDASGSTPVPSGLEKFYGQQLSWGGCSSYATTDDDRQYYASSVVQCARLTVPLAYDDPTGKTVTIGVLRKQATGGADRIGSLLFNPGGPGASGMSLVAQMAVANLGGDLGRYFDFVGFDPRGIGSSQPVISCLTDAERDSIRTMDPRSNTAAAVTAANDLQKKIAADCVARTGTAQGIDGKTFLANVGTRDVARDMDVLRAALGDAKLNYVGYSYGTRIGYVYAEEFPRNIRAMILDGVASPNQDPATDVLGQAKGFQDAFNAFATYCAAQSSCPLGKDPAKATTVFQGLVRPLLNKPLKVTDGRILSFTDATTGTIQALYSDSLRPQLIQALTGLQQGNGDGLMALADTYDDRGSTGHYGNEQDAFNAIRCQDENRMTDPAEITKLNAQYNAAAPFTDSGDPAGAIADICSFWPVAPTWTPHTLSIPNLATTLLVVSTKGDPATPYQNGVDLATQLHASLLSIEGTRHTGYLLSGITCADQVGNTYLETLKTPAAGTDCS